MHIHVSSSTPTRQFVLICTFIVTVSFSVFIPGGAALSAAEGIARSPFVVDLGGFEAQGELTYPANEAGPFPTVVLVHGSGPADMDFTMTDFDPATGMPFVRSAIFADIAVTLSEAGFAVARFNKRYVQGPNDVDIVAYITHVTMQSLATDAQTVIEHVKTDPRVNDDAIFLYGWSEGSVIAAHLATERADVSGLILHAPVALEYRDTIMYQIKDVGLEFLRQAADDDPVTVETLVAMIADTEAGPAARNILNYVADPAAFQAGQIAVSTLLDGNSDGELDIDREIVPALDMLVDFALGPFGTFAMYGSGRGLPVLTEQVDALDVPVLILQGDEDGHVPADGARQLARSLEEVDANVTLHTYRALGHSLGPAPNPVQDVFAPMAVEPMEDVIDWLKTMSQ